MVKVQAGPIVDGYTFMMGDDQGMYKREKPAHPVLLDDYFIGQYPVTQALWKAVMGEGQNPSFFEGDQRPVESVSWHDINDDFLPQLNKVKEADYPGFYFRLPTEAEWEYTARGGKYLAAYFYAGSNHLKKVGWYDANSHKETKDVGLLQPNALGLYDMSGNVWEWCWDWYDDAYYQTSKRQGVVENPSGPNKGAIPCHARRRLVSLIRPTAGCRSRGRARPGGRG